MTPFLEELIEINYCIYYCLIFNNYLLKLVTQKYILEEKHC